MRQRGQRGSNTTFGGWQRLKRQVRQVSPSSRVSVCNASACEQRAADRVDAASVRGQNRPCTSRPRWAKSGCHCRIRICSRSYSRPRLAITCQWPVLNLRPVVRSPVASHALHTSTSSVWRIRTQRLAVARTSQRTYFCAVTAHWCWPVHDTGDWIYLGRKISPANSPQACFKHL